MARRDALLRLHKSLVARRDELRKRLGGNLKDLKTGDAVGDTVDQAFDTGSGEVNSQLAQLESRELIKIQRAIDRLKKGTYGVCEGCAKKIPVSRLNALPFSTTCIECQREMEMYGSWEGRGEGDWNKVSDTSFEEQRDLKLSDLEMDFSSR
jgi:DnaK suppressor protein